MGSPLRLGVPHHIRLTVTDVARSQAFSPEVFGFQVALPGPPDDDLDGLVAGALQGGVVLITAGVMIGCARSTRRTPTTASTRSAWTT